MTVWLSNLVQQTNTKRFFFFFLTHLWPRWCGGTLATFATGLWSHQLVNDKSVCLCGKIFHYKACIRICTLDCPWPLHEHIEITYRHVLSLEWFVTFLSVQAESRFISYLHRPFANSYLSRIAWHGTFLYCVSCVLVWLLMCMLS